MTTLKNGSVVEAVKALLPYREELLRINAEFDDAVERARASGDPSQAFDILWDARRLAARRHGDLWRRAMTGQ